jgi:hypothetical protein
LNPDVGFYGYVCPVRCIYTISLNEASENCDEGTRGQSAIFVPDIPVCDITSGQGLHFNSAIPTDDRPPPPRYEETSTISVLIITVM